LLIVKTGQKHPQKAFRRMLSVYLGVKSRIKSSICPKKFSSADIKILESTVLIDKINDKINLKKF